MPEKPLGHRAYGHIAHLPGSRVGPGDHTCHEGQARICTVKTRDRHDRVIVQAKLDGSCCAVAKVGGDIVALVRAGYPAVTAPYEQHQLFAGWVLENRARFDAVLREGERMVGEWLAQAHGTRYRLQHEPFVAFDLMVGTKRATVAELRVRTAIGGFVLPHMLHEGGAFSVRAAVAALNGGFHGELDVPEGAVWRVERDGKVDYLAKWVRPDKVDGQYLPEIGDRPAVWNWRPQRPCATGGSLVSGDGAGDTACAAERL